MKVATRQNIKKTLSHMLMLLGILVFLLTGLASCGNKDISSDSQMTVDGVLTGCKEAMSNVSSVHVQSRTYYKYENQEQIDILKEGDYYMEKPDKTHVMLNQDYHPEYIEEWILGDVRYLKYSNGEVVKESLESPQDEMLKEVYIFDYAENPEMLPEETINGAGCYVISANIPPIDPRGDYRITYYIDQEDFLIRKSVMEVYFDPSKTGYDESYWEISEDLYLDYNDSFNFTPPEA